MTDIIKLNPYIQRIIAGNYDPNSLSIKPTSSISYRLSTIPEIALCRRVNSAVSYKDACMSLDTNVYPSPIPIYCLICSDKLTQLSACNICSDYKCHDQYCNKCFSQSFVVTITNTSYSVPTIKCCICLTRISAMRWNQALSLYKPRHIGSIEDNKIREDIDGAMLRLVRNARAILQYRCTGCESGKDLYIPYKDVKHGSSKHLYQLREIFVIRHQHMITAVMSTSSVEAILQTWVTLKLHMITPKQCVSHISDIISQDVNNIINGIGSSLYPSSIQDYNDRIASLIAPKIMKHIILRLASLTYDIEYRVKFLFSFYQAYPKFYTICCDDVSCFQCNISSHHPENTCQEMQNERYSKSVQYCSGCQVPTVKTDGCSSMTCVCGEGWTWDTSLDENTEDESVTEPSPYDDYNDPFDTDRQYHSNDTTKVSYQNYGTDRRTMLGPIQCPTCLLPDYLVLPRKYPGIFQQCCHIKADVHARVDRIDKFLQSYIPRIPTTNKAANGRIRDLNK